MAGEDEKITFDGLRDPRRRMVQRCLVGRVRALTGLLPKRCLDRRR
jgi:hypothetical protein